MNERQTIILEAATQCIARSGVRGLRVHDVAKQAEVSTSLLYYHFKDRNGLLAATLEHINGTASDYRTQGSEGASALERLEARLLGEIQDRDQVWANSVAWNELRATAVFEPDIATPLAQTTAVWHHDIASLIVEVQREDKQTADQDARKTAVVLTSLVEGLSGRWLTGELSADEARGLLRDTIHTYFDH
ncbi:TetR/AcrR family transcriptional regulator [Knoellia sp. CPCC 206453]|uniref:TetR/AcrR family transcriptional regulator n=1 Tax=Knoellia pratensis TaxID=3404796 RepID=UPI003613B8D8